MDLVNGSLAIFCGLCIVLLNTKGSGAVAITVTPQDDCVCSGQPVQFDCTAVVERSVFGGGTVLQTASQRWEINTTESTVMVVSGPPMAIMIIPDGYEFVSVNSVPAGRPTGLRVLSPDLSLNQATFTCIGYDPQDPSIESVPTPAVTLEVAGFPEFQCSVSCPQVYSSVSDSCTVQWTTPVTASCESVTGFTVTVSGNGVTVNSPVQDAASLSYMTEPLEPFQNYTATVTAMSSCGSSSQCPASFMSPKEEGASPITIGFTQPKYEATESSGSVMVTVESLTVTDRSVQIRISTLDLTALASMDYTSVDTIVVLMAGSSSWSVPISIIDDDFIEPNERFVVTMETTDSGVELGQRRAEVVIRTDDDCPTSSALTSDRFVFSSDPLLIRCMSVCNQHLKRGRICPNL